LDPKSDLPTPDVVSDVVPTVESQWYGGD
jgi:hypothetical protein